jgi:hypothetical protein
LKFRQAHPDFVRAIPMRLKLKGWLGVLVIFLAMIGQASHTHGEANGLKAHPETSISAAGLTADTCPLCVAMHSANAAVIASAQISEVLEMTEAPVLPERFFASQPGRAYQSRPPPLS